ncbi:hypothetical protein CONPUDRAFT_76336 [Coniophora puteana RWD-64-598 SS2]|uniref:Uncharacterized protein n=1 Tax=Coniophora puteana (strain RWD-64-598) TaxID=741705 RepID=A0A5M3MCG2_CONPW|nr:uncharacterized protein CONPUDRAFT_76336 [Coniophora puteana RWD-64-598 SS2]EIW76733.1 hypothetical protein CONPUDRAFT_76336 [Coniophora puteana RWD-64-598 SS2]
MAPAPVDTLLQKTDTIPHVDSRPKLKRKKPEYPPLEFEDNDGGDQPVTGTKPRKPPKQPLRRVKRRFWTNYSYEELNNKDNEGDNEGYLSAEEDVDERWQTFIRQRAMRSIAKRAKCACD